MRILRPVAIRASLRPSGAHLIAATYKSGSGSTRARPPATGAMRIEYVPADAHSVRHVSSVRRQHRMESHLCVLRADRAGRACFAGDRPDLSTSHVANGDVAVCCPVDECQPLAIGRRLDPKANPVIRARHALRGFPRSRSRARRIRGRQANEANCRRQPITG